MKIETEQFYFKIGEEMAALFADMPEALENTFEIASRCNFEFQAKTYFLPAFDPPDGQTLHDYFETVAWRASSAWSTSGRRPRRAAVPHARRIPGAAASARSR